ncbi:hypothetical protein A2U01_0069499, partial [Trifolium medium]|nr:hypothetical protein [Trifolium medium]
MRNDKMCTVVCGGLLRRGEEKRRRVTAEKGR